MATELAVIRNQLYEAQEGRATAEARVLVLEKQLSSQPHAGKGRVSGSDIFYAQPAAAAGALIPGLEELFRVAGCRDFLPAAEQWCRTNGATSAADLSDPIFAGIVNSLGLPPGKRDKLLHELHSRRRLADVPAGSGVAEMTKPGKDCKIQ